jgi:hypothetical protein
VPINVEYKIPLSNQFDSLHIYVPDQEESTNEYKPTTMIKIQDLHWTISEGSYLEVGQQLVNWVHPERLKEITIKSIKQLQSLLKEAIYRLLIEWQRPQTVMTLSNKNDFLIPTTIETNDGKCIAMDALLDSGATSSFIDQNFAQRNGIPIMYTDRPIQVYNADRTPNNNGTITGYVEVLLQIEQHAERIQLGITSLGKLDAILGVSWMKTHNPRIDWEEGWVHFDRCPEECRHKQIRLSRNISVEIEYQLKKEKVKKTMEEMIPERYHKYIKDIFEEETFQNKLLPRRPWDHTIDMEEGWVPESTKAYPLGPEEQEEMKSFIQTNLASGQIRLSISPQASPFFFVRKKDGRLQPVQGYRRLNTKMRRNRYPLPLIQELCDWVKGAKYFSKSDIQWGFCYDQMIRLFQNLSHDYFI